MYRIHAPCWNMKKAEKNCNTFSRKLISGFENNIYKSPVE